MYISAWEVFTKGIRSVLGKAANDGQVDENDTVWYGPSGDAVVASDPGSLDEEYADYVDEGKVSEYLD